MLTLVFEAIAAIEPTQIIYGGSFDPPHEGHARLVGLALEKFPRAQLRVIPAAVPAGAHGQHKTPSASFVDRLAMCELQFTGSSVKVDPIESRLPTPNYTLRTLEALASEQPGERWALLLGRDQLQGFAGWYAPDAIIARASLLVVDRDGDDKNAASLVEALQALSKKLARPLIARANDQWQWQDLPTGVLYLGRSESIAASRLIRSDVSASGAWLLPAVHEYIKRQGLYSS